MAVDKLLEWYNGDKMASDILKEKYLMKDEELPNDMWRRLASSIAKVESDPDNSNSDNGVEVYDMWNSKFYELLKDWKFIPGGRINYAVGRDEKVSCTNCYVVPIRDTIDYESNNEIIEADSIEGIYNWLKESALTYRSTGGVGVDISVLRPKGTKVKNSGGESPGATSFMDLMSRSTHTVHQKLRRGALMITINVHHPDILNFINIKKILGQINYAEGEGDGYNDLYKLVEYANISVLITDEFLEALEKEEKYEQRFPVDVEKPQIKKKVSAKKIWNAIVENAHAHAEPGILFIDNHRRNDSLGYINPTITTNPCFVDNTKLKTSDGLIEIKELALMYANEVKMPKILTFNVDTKQLEWEEIIQAGKTGEDKNIIEIETDDGCILRLTPNHKIYTENRGYIEAAKLTEEDILISIE
jgi:ribonucleoside-diphosphate reductase alpha chain